ncbi:DUF664 domain-containing protein [Streptomyces sp. M10(2022)]
MDSAGCNPHHRITRRGEAETLTAFLGYYRSTLLQKCAGLSGKQLAEQTVQPSNLTLLGLIRHMAKVERIWFREGSPAKRWRRCTTRTRARTRTLRICRRSTPKATMRASSKKSASRTRR